MTRKYIKTGHSQKTETERLYRKKYRELHKEERKTYNREYRLKNKEAIRELRKAWKIGNKEHIKAYQNKWYKKRTPKTRKEHYLRDKNRRDSIRNDVLIFYSGNPPYCVCCGEKEVLFLALDHINNDGAKHRKELKTSKNVASGHRIYKWAKDNNYPPIFQILCHNCNFGKWRNKGICPHKQNEKN